MPLLYLASASPRRAALLAQLGVPFQVITPIAEEVLIPGGPVQAVSRAVKASALRKADEAAAGLNDGVVIAGDTVVLTDKGRVLGKPQTAENALAMLRRLVGTWHRVLSAVAVVDAATRRSRVRLVSARVWLRPVSESVLRRYVATGEPLDKAGAYAIQGLGSSLVSRVRGSYTAVIGFPLELVASLLEQFGFVISDRWVKSNLPSREKPRAEKVPSNSKRA
jgi:septum formation protein